MDFIDEVRIRSGQFADRLERLATEEATKSALVLPFIQMLGYEIFDPTEVVPEFTADIGTKKGEKVDYALIKDGKPTIVIECKKYGINLDQERMSQLLRYFTVTEAKFAILTDGIVYRFFSDLDKPNMMDAKPFFEFNMLDFSESGVEELKRFTKSTFNVEETVKAAATLKYTRGMKQAIARQLNAPDDEFVRWLAKHVYSKPLTQQARDRFTVLAKQALREFVNDRIKATLKTALDREAEVESETTGESIRDEGQPEIGEADRKLVTTAEEIEGYMIVKAILRKTLDVKRIFMRDTQSYCGIILDDNNRKPLCRPYFNSSRKYLGVVDGNRREDRRFLRTLDDIYDHAETIRATAERHLAADGNVVQSTTARSEVDEVRLGAAVKVAGDADAVNSAALEKASRRRPPLRFSDLDIPQGAEIQFTQGSATATVASENSVTYEGREYRLTPLTQQLRGSDKPLVATTYWNYQGRTLREIQEEVWSRE